MTFKGYRLKKLSDEKTQFYYDFENKKFLKSARPDDENLNYIQMAVNKTFHDNAERIVLPDAIFYVKLPKPIVYYLFPMMTVDLYRFNESHHMESCDIVFTIRCILDAVDFLHSKNIIHCDLKTENVVVSPKTRKAVIIDLDYATENDPIYELRDDEPYGTIIAPEMIEGEWNNSIDFYTIGYILHDLCVGSKDSNKHSASRKKLILEFKYIYDAMTRNNPTDRLGFVSGKGFCSQPIRDAFNKYPTTETYSNDFMDKILKYSESTDKHKTSIELI